MKDMVKFDWSFIMSEQIGNENGISSQDVDEWMNKSRSVSERICRERDEGALAFWNVLYDSSVIRDIEDIKKEFDDKDVENIVVLGIGGSALGARALFDGLRGVYHNFTSRPRLFIADNIDPESFYSLIELLDMEKTVFIVISKSGTTSETLAQFLVVKSRIVNMFGRDKLKNHLVIITDPSRGILRSFVKTTDVYSCSIPSNLGGRFSVLSPVGLVPLMFLGIDWKALLDGARAMAEFCEGCDVYGNPAYMNGLYHVIFDKNKNKRLHVYWAYSDSLYSFSDWLRQLIAESLGKKKDNIHVGPTPIKALGVTDQHSQLQLYREGPNDKVITFLAVEKWKFDLTIPEDSEIPDSDYLSGHSMGELFHAERQATACALAEAQRPNLTLWFPELNEYFMGQAFFLYELQTVFMGYLYGINPFNQPGVELSKKLTHGIMGKKGFEEFADFVNKMNKVGCVR